MEEQRFLLDCMLEDAIYDDILFNSRLLSDESSYMIESDGGSRIGDTVQ